MRTLLNVVSLQIRLLCKLFCTKKMYVFSSLIQALIKVASFRNEAHTFLYQKRFPRDFYIFDIIVL